jgi:hypothetical protein
MFVGLFELLETLGPIEKASPFFRRKADIRPVEQFRISLLPKLPL